MSEIFVIGVILLNFLFASSSAGMYLSKSNIRAFASSGFARIFNQDATILQNRLQKIAKTFYNDKHKNRFVKCHYLRIPAQNIIVHIQYASCAKKNKRK